MLNLFPSRAVALELGSLTVHWYALLYIAAFVLAWYVLPKLQRYRDLTLTREQWLELFTWALGGVIVGGRLGYVLFYEPAYFWGNPAQIFILGDGGMSSHGGFIGVGMALWLACRSLKIDFWKLLDVIVVPVALGLALGRLGNWINQEIYVSTTAHVLVIAKNLVIAGVAYIALLRWRRSGTALAVFLIAYAILRLVSEYLRYQEFPGALGLTRGQLLTIPVLLVGLWLWQVRKKAAT
ncbi:prolipoprotein diacylglyceryl transferase [bacterium]|nr:prolipoprotein diacylglyceryl transferase [bacterium]